MGLPRTVRLGLAGRRAPVADVKAGCFVQAGGEPPRRLADDGLQVVATLVRGDARAALIVCLSRGSDAHQAYKAAEAWLSRVHSGPTQLVEQAAGREPELELSREERRAGARRSAENAVDLAQNAGDRDALNEAAVFVGRVRELIPTLARNPCAERTWHRIDRAEKDVATMDAAVGNPNAYVQAKAGHSQFSTERYVHAAQVAFPGAADRAEERLFGPRR
jgi:hypothetical protein